jgi:hypothetical protein
MGYKIQVNEGAGWVDYLADFDKEPYIYHNYHSAECVVEDYRGWNWNHNLADIEYQIIEASK